MAVCPNCRTEQDKRKKGCCPNCGEEVSIHGGEWVRTSIGSPSLYVLERFEKHISKRLSTPTRKVVWVIPRKSMTYVRELSLAENILKQANYDMELVDEVLTELFEGEKMAWKNRESLVSVAKDFSMAMAIAIAKRKEKDEIAEKERIAYERTLQMEDIFAKR